MWCFSSEENKFLFQVAPLALHLFIFRGKKWIDLKMNSFRICNYQTSISRLVQTCLTNLTICQILSRENCFSSRGHIRTSYMVNVKNITIKMRQSTTSFLRIVTRGINWVWNTRICSGYIEFWTVIVRKFPFLIFDGTICWYDVKIYIALFLFESFS